VRLFLFELKKVVLKRGVLIIVVLLLAANIYNIYDSARGVYENSDKYKEGYNEVYSRVRGPLTLEGIDFVVREYRRLEEIVDSGQYSPEYDPETYTGYTYGDCGMLRDSFYEKLKYHYEYAQYSADVTARATENIRFYSEKNNGFEVSKNKKIAAVYKDRRLDSFYNTRGYEALFKHELSTFFIILICLFTFTPMIIYEREASMHPLLLTSKKGKNRVIAVKYFIAGAFLIVVCAVFYTLDFLMYDLCYGLDGHWNPLYCIETFKETPLNFNVFGYYVLTCFVRTAGIVVFAALFLLTSSLVKRALHGFVINVMIIFSLMLFAMFQEGNIAKLLNLLNPAWLLDCTRVFDKFYSLNIFGISVMTYSVRILLAAVCFAAALLLAIRLNRKITHMFVRKRGVTSEERNRV
jgi:hypothetical protein